MTDLFEDKAEEWDINEMVKALAVAVGSSILKYVPLNDQKRVMDFGAGTGLICSQVAPFVQKITAVDISESMLGNLVSKQDLKGKVEVLCQDIVETPIDEKFDLIMSAMAMHHVKETEKLIQRFAEHLDSGALIALSDLDKEDGSFHGENREGVHHFGFERKKLQTMLEQNGFVEIDFHTVHTVNKDEKMYPIFLVTAKKC